MNDIDTSALRSLRELMRELQGRGIRMLLAGCKGPVRDVLHKSVFASAGTTRALSRRLRHSVVV